MHHQIPPHTAHTVDLIATLTWLATLVSAFLGLISPILQALVSMAALAWYALRFSADERVQKWIRVRRLRARRKRQQAAAWAAYRRRNDSY
jgi:hypothetical protein